MSAYKDEEYKNMIFAIEEPETSQSPHNQKGIIEAIQRLLNKGSQILITTHSPAMAKEFSAENVNYIIVENNQSKSIVKNFSNNNEQWEYVIKFLGILPLDLTGKRLIVFVEGPDEQILLKKINEHIFKDDKIMFISGGGNGIHFHIACNYFENKIKLMALVDKGYNNSEDVKRKLKEIYKTSLETDYFIETEKEDITLYYKQEPEGDLYYANDKYVEEYNKDTGIKKQVLKEEKGKYNKQRKGDISRIIKNDILNNKRIVTKNDFYNVEEIEAWFQMFNNWKEVDLPIAGIERQSSILNQITREDTA